jgi:hypothetical protein
MSDNPTYMTLPDVIRICEESDADADAGRVVPATSVHAKIAAVLAAMREEPAPARHQDRRASPNR